MSLQAWFAAFFATMGTIAYLSLIPAMFPKQWNALAAYLARRGRAAIVRQRSLFSGSRFSESEELLDETGLGVDADEPFFAPGASTIPSAVDRISKSRVALQRNDFPGRGSASQALRDK